MKKVILSIVVIVIFAGAGYWYFVLRQSGPVSPNSSFTGEYPVAEKSQTQKTPRELIGIWKTKQAFRWYAPNKQFNEIQLSPEEKNSFFSFKDGSICQGQLDARGGALPCNQYQETVFTGDTMRVGNEVAKWVVKNKELEIIFVESDGTTPKERVVLTKYEQ